MHFEGKHLSTMTNEELRRVRDVDLEDLQMLGFMSSDEAKRLKAAINRELARRPKAKPRGGSVAGAN